MPSEVTNNVELRVAGMSRSGNHALLHWILAQAPGRACLLNCAEPRTNPFLSARPLGNGKAYRVNYRGFSLKRERAGQLSRKDWLVHSYEDCFLTMLASEPFETHHDDWVGRSAMRIDVLVLRDPFNLFASRLKSGYSGVTPRTAVRIWKQHARQALGLRRILPHRPTVVLFNAWHGDRSYRRRLAEELDLDFTDAGKEEVADCAGGSSFDRRMCHGRASQMQLADRWKHFVDDPRYHGLFDAELCDLSEQLFGSLPAAERLLLREASLTAPSGHTASNRSVGRHRDASA